MTAFTGLVLASFTLASRSTGSVRTIKGIGIMLITIAEFCYGGHPYDSPGIFQVTPKQMPDIVFRCAFDLLCPMPLTLYVIQRIDPARRDVPVAAGDQGGRQRDGHRLYRRPVPPAHKVRFGIREGICGGIRGSAGIHGHA